MNYRQFEKNIQHTLSQHKEEVDTYALLQSLGLNDHADKKDRKVIAWWLTGSTFIGLITFLLFNLPSNNKSYTQNPVAQSSNKITSPSLPLSTSVTNEIKNIQDETQNDFVKNAKTENLPILKSGTKNEIPSTIYNNKFSSIANPISISKQRAQGSNKSNLVNNTFSQLDENSTANISEVTSNIATAEANTTIIKDHAQDQNKNELIALSALPLYTIPFLSKPYSGISLSKNTNKIICPSFSKSHKVLFSVIPEIGYFMPRKTLSQIAPDPASTFTLREQNEKTLEGLQAGLYLKAQREDLPIYVKVGGQYTRLSERMDLTYNYIKRDTTQGIISITVSQSGDTITAIIGDIVKETKISGTQRAHYNLSTIDIPVAIGIEKFANNFYFGGELGVVANLRLGAKGSILTSPTAFSNTGVSQNFASRLGLSYLASVHVGKQFAIGKLYLAVRTRFIPSSFTSSGASYSQKYNFFGTHLGWEYSF
jgi:hypothetical protein